MIFMAGARSHKGGEYLRDETALKYGAGPERDTRDAKEAYAPFPPFVPGPPAELRGLALGVAQVERVGAGRPS